MVIPLGGFGGGGGLEMQDPEPPPKLRNQYYIWWWLLAGLLVIDGIGCAIAVEIFKAIIVLIVAFWAYYMVKDNCQKMSQQCIFSYGLMCAMQGVFEFIFLCMSLPGRSTRTTTTNPPNDGGHAPPSGNPFMGPHGGARSSSYTVTIKTIPFFSEEQGWYYNFQSGMMIANVVVFLLGAILCKVCYAEFTSSMFADNGDEGQAFGSSPYGYGGGGFGGGGAAGYSGSGGYAGGGGGGGRFSGASPGVQGQTGGRSGNSANSRLLFGGTGQRLGNN